MDRRMDHRHHDGGLVCSEVCVVSCAAIGGTTTHLHGTLPSDIDVVPHQSHPLAQANIPHAESSSWQLSGEVHVIFYRATFCDGCSGARSHVALHRLVR